MSLINQLLQDLDKRRASDAETRSLSPPVRALPGGPRPGVTLAAVLLGAAVVAAIGWFIHSEYWKRTAAGVPIIPVVPEARPVTVAATAPPSSAQEALVREALAVPVFQLAEELQFAPPLTPAAPSVAKRKPGAKPLTAHTTSVAASVPPAPVAQVPSRPEMTPGSSGRVPNPSAAPDVEEVVIADVPQSAPVEKQMREPTTLERAEMEFRNAVARLRQGRVVDAEAGFRAALTEDRSHASARQALIGLLVDSGRNDDAEAVLRETLSVNPRQPRHAMLLARLELERGDAAGAARTLEAARQYAGVDADFFAFLAAVYQRLGRHQEAADWYARALTVTSGNAVWMMGLGISLEALRRTDEARTAFRSAADSKTLSTELQAFVESRLSQLPAPKR